MDWRELATKTDLAATEERVNTRPDGRCATMPLDISPPRLTPMVWSLWARSGGIPLRMPRGVLEIPPDLGFHAAMLVT